jgi:type II secretory pathway pseudopilin PulG
MEIIIVMVIVSITIGGSVFLLSNESSDEIQTLPSEIEQLAKTSLSKAKLTKQTHYILISKSHLWISTNAELAEPPPTATNKITLPANCSIGYKRSGETQWQWIKTNNDKAIWVFSVAGICEEFSITLKVKQSSAELNFHPLTAAIIKP